MPEKLVLPKINEMYLGYPDYVKETLANLLSTTRIFEINLNQDNQEVLKIRNRNYLSTSRSDLKKINLDQSIGFQVGEVLDEESYTDGWKQNGEDHSTCRFWYKLKNTDIEPLVALDLVKTITPFIPKIEIPEDNNFSQAVEMRSIHTNFFKNRKPNNLDSELKVSHDYNHIYFDRTEFSFTQQQIESILKLEYLKLIKFSNR
jgi:hypothetical protein